MSENKPDLMAELAEVVGKIEAFRDLPFNAERRKLYTDAASAAVELIRTHHAELEAVVRDAGRIEQITHVVREMRNAASSVARVKTVTGKRAADLLNWYADKIGIDQAMHNSAREG